MSCNKRLSLKDKRDSVKIVHHNEDMVYSQGVISFSQLEKIFTYFFVEMIHEFR
jgi:hypothetical protein